METSLVLCILCNGSFSLGKISCIALPAFKRRVHHYLKKWEGCDHHYHQKKNSRGEDDEMHPKAIFWTVRAHEDDVHDHDNNLYWTRVASGLGVEDRKEIESSPASLSSAQVFFTIFSFLPLFTGGKKGSPAQFSNDTQETKYTYLICS